MAKSRKSLKRSSRRSRRVRRNRSRKQRGGEVIEKRFENIKQLRDFLKEARYVSGMMAKEGALGASIAADEITSEMRSGEGALTLTKYTDEVEVGNFTITNANIAGLKFLFRG